MTSYEYAPSLAHIIQREAQALISALVVVSFSYLDWVSSVYKSNKIYTFYDPAVFYV